MLEHQGGQRLLRREGPEFSVTPQSGQSTETSLSTDLAGAELSLSLSLGTDPRPLHPAQRDTCWETEVKHEPLLVYRDDQHCAGSAESGGEAEAQEAEAQAALAWSRLAPASEEAAFFDSDQQAMPAAPPKRKRRRAALDVSALMGILILGGALFLDYTTDVGSEASLDQPPLLGAQGKLSAGGKITDRLPAMARLDGERRQPGEDVASAAAAAADDRAPVSHVTRQVPTPSVAALPVKTVIVRSDGTVVRPPETAPELGAPTQTPTLPALPAVVEDMPAAPETQDTPAAAETESIPLAAETPPAPEPKGEPQASIETAATTPSASVSEEPPATLAAEKTVMSPPRDANPVAVPLPERRPAFARLRKPVPSATPTAAPEGEPQWQLDVFAR